MTRRPIVTALAIAAGVGLAYWFFAPEVVNLDGKMYVGQAFDTSFVPGHLAYLPVLRALASLTGARDGLDLAGPAQALSIVATALGIAALHRATRLLVGPRAAWIAAIGCAASFGALQDGSDIEVYAVALGWSCAALWCIAERRTGGGFGWVLGAAVALAMAALFHVENAFALPAAALACAGAGGGRIRRRDAIAAAAIPGVIVLAAYVVANLSRGGAPTAFVSLAFESDHHINYPVNATAFAGALAGMARTIIYAPYFYEASAARVYAQAGAGALALVVMAWLAARPGRTRLFGLPVTILWVLPYLVIGVGFFGTDNERWLFLLPLAWLVVSAGAAASSLATRIAVGLIVVLVACDLVLWLPQARSTWTRERAIRATEIVANGDLVISVGMGWDEYIGFYVPRTPERFRLFSHGGRSRIATELPAAIASAWARGAQVYLAGMHDDASGPGWKDMRARDISPAFVESLVGHRLTEVAPGLVRVAHRLAH